MTERESPFQDARKRADEVRQWADLNGGELDWLIEDEAVREAVEKALWLAPDVECLLHALQRAAFVAEHLMQMIDPQTWRDTGGDDGQGHYEGEYHAEQLAAEIASWKAEAV